MFSFSQYNHQEGEDEEDLFIYTNFPIVGLIKLFFFIFISQVLKDWSCKGNIMLHSLGLGD